MKYLQGIDRAVKFSEWLVYITLFSLPLIYFPGLTFSYTSSKFVFFGTMALVTFAFTAWILFQSPKLLKNIFTNKLFLFGTCFYFAAYFAAVLHSANIEYSFWGSFERGTGGAMMILLFLFTVSVYVLGRLRGKEFMKRALLASFLGALMLSITIILSPDGFNVLRGSLIANGGGGSLMGNSSIAAAYILLNIFFGVVLAAEYQKTKNKIWMLVGVFLLLASPLFINFHFSHSLGIMNLVGLARGATIGIMGGALMALGLYLWFSPNKTSRNIGIAICGLFTLSLVYVSVLLIQPDSFLHAKFIQFATETRFQFWHIVFEGFHVHPVLGWGPENFDYVFHTYFDPHAIVSEGRLEIILDRPHNVLLEQLAGGGMLLLLAFLSYITTTAWGFVRAVRNSFLTRTEGALLLGALFGWFLQNQFVFDSPTSLVIIALVSGLSASLYSSHDGREQDLWQHNPTKEYIALGCISLVTIAAIIYISILPAIKAHAMKSIFNDPISQRAEEWSDLGGISPIGNVSDTGFFGDEIYQQYVSKLATWRTASDADKALAVKDIQAGISHFKNMTENGGSGYRNYRLNLLVGKFYILKFLVGGGLTPAEFSEAEDYAKRATALSLTDPESNWVLAQIYFSENKIDAVKDILAKAAALEPQISETYELMLKIAIVSRDEKYYTQAVAQAKAAIPGFSLKR